MIPNEVRRETEAIALVGIGAGEWQMVASGKANRTKPIGGNSMGARKSEVRRYSEAVAIKVAEGSIYAEALRKMRGAANLLEIGVEVEKIRTKSGDMLVQIRKGKGEAEKLRGALARILGNEANVRIVSVQKGNN